MPEKLPFSPYPPQARTLAPKARRSRRRLLPFLLFAIVALIYFSRSHRTPVLYDPPTQQVQQQHAAIGKDDAAGQRVQKAGEAKQGLAQGVKETAQEQIKAPTAAKADAKHAIAKLDDEPKPVTLPTEAAQKHLDSEATKPDSATVSDSLLHVAKPVSEPAETTATTIKKITMDAHIMSKCPDARDCLRDMVVPAMEEISDLVNFNLSSMQTIKPDGSVECLHGPSECLGDTLVLCAQNLYPNSTIRSLGFANCMISNYRDIPERAHVQNCALEHGVNFDALNECASDTDRGERLLKEAVQWTRAAGVTNSCTVRVAGKKWCVRDGGEWKECEGGSDVKSLVAHVKKLAAADSKDTAPKVKTETGTGSAVADVDTEPAVGQGSKANAENIDLLKNSTSKGASKDTSNLANLGES